MGPKVGLLSLLGSGLEAAAGWDRPCTTFNQQQHAGLRGLLDKQRASSLLPALGTRFLHIPAYSDCMPYSDSPPSPL